MPPRRTPTRKPTTAPPARPRPTLAARLGRTPPARWDALISNQAEEDLELADRDTAWAAIHLVRLAAYLRARRNGHGHDDAVKRQNTAAGRVREALGFTQHRDDLTF